MQQQFLSVDENRQNGPFYNQLSHLQYQVTQYQTIKVFEAKKMESVSMEKFLSILSEQGTVFELKYNRNFASK